MCWTRGVAVAPDAVNGVSIGCSELSEYKREGLDGVD